MEPLTPEQLARSIARVTVTDLRTGAVQQLTTRPDSACHFFDRFSAGPYEVQLRLDWSDIDPNGHPRMDADLINPDTGKHVHSKRAKSVHHTDSVGPGDRRYEWQFEDARLHLRVAVDWMLSGSATTAAKASCKMRVTRADGTVEEHG